VLLEAKVYKVLQEVRVLPALKELLEQRVLKVAQVRQELKEYKGFKE
jgi:hypothetical protein